VDSAAQGSDRKVICERCFARVAESEVVCPECGAPMKPNVMVPAVDSAVHPELAQANLLRLRGDVDAAERKCLSILKRFPNEPEAHVLLGELSADRGDWRRAVEWYELAVDLNPTSTADQAKLEDAKRRVQDAETAETVEQLGLPETPSRTPWLVGAVVVILCLVIVAAVVTNRQPTNRTPPPLRTRVVAPMDQTDSGSSGDNSQSATDSGSQGSTGGAAPVAPTPSMPVEDRTLLDLLVKRSTEGGQIQSLVEDPRDHNITLTYVVPSNGDARKVGAILAKDALSQSTDTTIVTVRGVSGDQLVYVADATRPKLNEIDETDKSDDWMATLMEREWTPQENASPGPPAAATTGEAPATNATAGAGTTATGTNSVPSDSGTTAGKPGG